MPVPEIPGPESHVLMVVHVQPHHLQGQGQPLENFIGSREIIRAGAGSRNQEVVAHRLEGEVVVVVAASQLVPCELVLLVVYQASQVEQFAAYFSSQGSHVERIEGEDLVISLDMDKSCPS